jgi:hypothetical protein
MEQLFAVGGSQVLRNGIIGRWEFDQSGSQATLTGGIMAISKGTRQGACEILDGKMQLS